MAAEADDVEAGDSVDTLGAAVVRDVFAEGAVALDDASISDPKELVKHRSAADEATVADVDVASEEGGVCDDIAGAELHVMAEMTADHEKVVRTEAGEASDAAAAVDGDMFAEGAAGTDTDPAFGFGIKAKILRRSADDGSTADFAILVQVDIADDLGVGEESATRTDDGWAINDDVRANLAGGIDLGGGIDNGCGVNHEGNDGVGMSGLKEAGFAEAVVGD